MSGSERCNRAWRSRGAALVLIPDPLLPLREKGVLPREFVISAFFVATDGVRTRASLRNDHGISTSALPSPCACIDRGHGGRVCGDMMDARGGMLSLRTEGAPMPLQEKAVMDLRQEVVALANQEGANVRELCRLRHQPHHRLPLSGPLVGRGRRRAGRPLPPPQDLAAADAAGAGGGGPRAAGRPPGPEYHHRQPAPKRVPDAAPPSHA